jgi:flagellin
MNQEFQQLSQEITRIATSTTFNGIALLNDTTTRNIHVGSTTTINVSGAKMDAAALGLTATKSYASNTASMADPNDANFATTADGDTMTFTFGAQTGTTVNWTTAAGNTGARSMNQIVSDINSAAGYQAATAVYDSNTNLYTLKMTAKNGGADALVITGASIPAALADANFSKTTGSANGLNIGSTGNPADALTGVAAAIQTKDTYRSELGYMMNRLQSAVRVVDIQAENLQTAGSRISDVDVATEMAAMTRTNVLAQAGISMLAQANNMPQMALTLLRG